MKGVHDKRVVIVFPVVVTLAALGVRGKVHMLKVSLVQRGENLWLGSGEEAPTILREWRRQYNEYRPHRSLGNFTPMAFAKEA